MNQPAVRYPPPRHRFHAAPPLVRLAELADLCHSLRQCSRLPLRHVEERRLSPGQRAGR